MLRYDRERSIWRCPSFWMSDTTFQRYVAVWFEDKPPPTQAELLEVVERCCKESYWIRGIDPDVHFISAVEQR